ncbi:MAG: ribulose-phosphate 3-epimerase [Anaeroplasmataceae bacterium]
MKLSPSFLTCDFSNLKNELDQIKDYVEYIHVDVMDGDFVPNITFGPKFVGDFRKYYPNNIFDVHLMISNPLKYVEAFAGAGSDIITFHYESKSNVMDTINEIKKFNKKVGLSIKPNTDVSEIEKYLPFVDLVLVMSVEPGFGGQKFMPSSVRKIELLEKYRKENGYKYLIEVDGGINNETIKDVVAAKVDIVVAGSYIMNTSNKKERIEILMNN